MNTKLHAVTDANGRPISLFMTAGQISDYIGATALLDSLPRPVASGRPRLRRRLVPGRLAGQGDHAVHPRPQNPHRTHPLRQATLQAAKPDRNHVWTPERLAPGRHPLRSLSDRLPVRHSPRRYRAVLAMSPEPRVRPLSRKKRFRLTPSVPRPVRGAIVAPISTRPIGGPSSPSSNPSTSQPRGR